MTRLGMMYVYTFTLTPGWHV